MRSNSKRKYWDGIPSSNAKDREELRKQIKEAEEASKHLTEWPDPEDYR